MRYLMRSRFAEMIVKRSATFVGCLGSIGASCLLGSCSGVVGGGTGSLTGQWIIEAGESFETTTTDITNAQSATTTLPTRSIIARLYVISDQDSLDLCQLPNFPFPYGEEDADQYDWSGVVLNNQVTLSFHRTTVRPDEENDAEFSFEGNILTIGGGRIIGACLNRS